MTRLIIGPQANVAQETSYNIRAARTGSVSLAIQKSAFHPPHLIYDGSEDEGQDALHSDLNAVKDCRFENPLTRRLYSRASQREVATDGCGFNDQPFFRNGNLHLDRPCGLHLFGAWRVERFDSGNHAALQIAFRNLHRFLRQWCGGWRRRRRWRLAQVVSRGQKV